MGISRVMLVVDHALASDWIAAFVSQTCYGACSSWWPLVGIATWVLPYLLGHPKCPATSSGTSNQDCSFELGIKIFEFDELRLQKSKY
jgi:hypothetical protein